MYQPDDHRLVTGEMTVHVDNDLIELAERCNDGVNVRLLWRRGAAEVVLVVSDERKGASFGVDVPGDRALDAFRHPFLYVEPVTVLGEAIAVLSP
jgi:hypothetical protein